MKNYLLMIFKIIEKLKILSCNKNSDSKYEYKRIKIYMKLFIFNQLIYLY